MNETGFRLLCHKVLQHRDALEIIDADATVQAIRAIRAVLEDRPAWMEWPYVALDYRRATADHSIDPSIAAWINDPIPMTQRLVYYLSKIPWR